MEHFALKISLLYLISTRLIDQLSSRGSIPPISSDESWSKLFVPHKITTLLRLEMTERFWACYKTFWALSLYIPQFKVYWGSRYFVQTLRYLFSPAAIEYPIIIDLKQFVIKLEQWWRWSSTDLFLKTLSRKLPP